MKILMINGIYGRGSSGRSIADIRTLLSAGGHKVFVATPKRYEGEDFYRIGNELDHKLHGLLSRLTGKQAHFSSPATRRFLKFIDGIRPDLVHLQVVHGNYLDFPMLMKHLSAKRIPAVFVLDDCWYFTGKCCHYTANGCYKWRTLCHDCPRVHEDNPSWFLDCSRELYQEKKALFEGLPKYAVVTVSDWLRGEAMQSYLKDAAIVRRIYNSIDIDRFRYRDDCTALKKQLGLEEDKIILGVAADWRDRNGLSKGIRLFLKLAEMLPDGVKIVLIGNPDKTLALPDNIIAIPFVEGAEELARYYSMADVFVQMSGEETFGRVTAEALSCGTPAVVFDATANPELIGPGCGAAVENGNVDAMARRINGILSEGREKYSPVCRKFAEDNFNFKRIAGQFLALYDDLLAK